METSPHSPTSSTSPASPASTASAGSKTLHPLILSAAVAVVLFCAVGSAAIMGWLPDTHARDSLPLASNPPASQQAYPPDGHSHASNTPMPVAYADVDSTRAGLPNQAVERTAPAVCNQCGVISAIRSVEHRGQGTGMGAAGGAILGGLLGNQVGSGHGRQLATVAGAVGGAVAGNQVEGNMKTTHSWEITVRMDNGARRVLHQSAQPQWHEGDAVRIVNGQLRAN